MTDQPEPADHPAPYEPPATAEPAPYEPPAAADHETYQSSATAEPVFEPAPPVTDAAPADTPPEPVAAQPFTAPDPFAPLSVPVAQLPGTDPATAGPYSPPPPGQASSSGTPPLGQTPPYSPPPPGQTGAPGYGAPYPGYAPAVGPPPSNGLAIGALVCSILGFCTCLVSVPGVIMGHIALAKSSRGEAGGRGIAIAALFLGYISAAAYIGFFVTLIVLGTNGKLGS